MSLPPTTPVTPQPAQTSTTDVLLGLGLLAVSHVAAVVMTGGIALVFLGVLQLIYVVPVVIAVRRASRRGIATGMIIGASVTFLLNAGCWGVVLFSNIRP